LDIRILSFGESADSRPVAGSTVPVYVRFVRGDWWRWIAGHVATEPSPMCVGALNQGLSYYEAMRAAGSPLDRRSRIAIIVAEQDLSHDFIEIVFCNAGYVCEKFPDEDSALEWLRR
jgi:hypothetical protein